MRQAPKEGPVKGGSGKPKEGIWDSLVGSAVPGKRVPREEAFKIMNFDPSKKVGKDALNDRYKDYYEKNDPDNGGSYYIRSKIKNAYKTLQPLADAEPTPEPAPTDTPAAPAPESPKNNDTK